MKIKPLFCLLICLSAFIFYACPKTTYGCKDATATNYDMNADQSCSGCCTFPPKQGGFLFWSEDPNAISTCGTFNITLNNGKQSTITGYYINPGPANCVNQVGGYFLLDVGTYQYTITRGKGCPGGSGTITVTEGCNKLKID
jgi:hypothetical protein